MELKRVSNYSNKEYAKKEEITKKELKNNTPVKWITASALGLATLLYTSPKSSIHKIGVVFGCIEIEENFNYSSTFHILNNIFDVVYYVGIASGIAMVLSLIIGIFFLGKNTEKQEKITKLTKIFLGVFIAALVIGIIMYLFLQSDAPILYENGVKKSLGYSF